ncbi:MAG TPA: serine/threonine-protein kinase [Usitatibacter sp.]|nr:serine/threonine-protein kinase [Usitatibacter sp.]
MAETPESIGKYRVTRPLGRGAMGMVYEGFDPVIERRVAIKTILAEYLEAAEMQEASARFKREAQAGGRLQHPSIVGVYEYGEDKDMAYIVMEYVEGRELKSVLRDGPPLELIDTFEIMKQLLGALDYSHKQGVVHRDIKPANVMVAAGNKVKVMDFGIARLESSSLTQVGTVVGTPTHMSPEQLMGIPADGRADLWSAGVILYEMLTGVSPFLSETPAAVMHKVLQLEPDAPSRVKAGVPPGFDAVVARALAKKSDARFQTAIEFAAAILQVMRFKPGSTSTAARGPSAERSQRVATAVRAAPTLAIDPAALAEIERSLSRHVGPLAGVLVKRTQGESATLEDFFRALAENIPDRDEQKVFLKKMALVKPAAGTGTSARTVPTAAAPATAARPVFSPETLSAAEKRLASYVGPLARVLIRQAAESSGNIKELYAQLATHIDSEEERSAFLDSLPR